MIDVALQADCAHCAALCCMAFSFDASSQFAIDKESGVACPNLGGAGRCTIHTALAEKGFNGCVQYDCFGAGQQVTQQVFDGRSWQDDASLKVPMMDAFRAMRSIHDLLLLLNEADKLALSAAQRVELGQLVDLLQPDEAWTRQSLHAFEQGPMAGDDVRSFLSSLRSIVQRS